MLKVYAYAKCDTCRKALKFLESREIEHRVIPIRDQPPSKAELKKMLDYVGGNLRLLFNTSGGDYKALGLKDRMARMSQAEAFELLSTNGNLVKRPFVVADGFGLTGFDENDWKEHFR
ncbi:MAG: hypothetical protein AMXMBFR84_38810 [Candidatus Hydrogenedentota bacterium]